MVKTLQIAVSFLLWQGGGFDGICFRTVDDSPRLTIQQEFGALPGASQITKSLLTESDPPAFAGTLLRGQPYLSELAWSVLIITATTLTAW